MELFAHEIYESYGFSSFREVEAAMNELEEFLSKYNLSVGVLPTLAKKYRSVLHAQEVAAQLQKEVDRINEVIIASCTIPHRPKTNNPTSKSEMNLRRYNL